LRAALLLSASKFHSVYINSRPAISSTPLFFSQNSILFILIALCKLFPVRNEGTQNSILFILIDKNGGMGTVRRPSQNSILFILIDKRPVPAESKRCAQNSILFILIVYIQLTCERR